MEIKYIIFLAGSAVAVPAGTIAALNMPRLRDFFFFAMIAGTIVTNTLDINFVSREVYRGSSRGIEISFVDILALIVLGCACMGPKIGPRRFFWPPSLALMILYFFYCCFSIAISDPKIFGVLELSKIFRGMIIFLAVAMSIKGRRELQIIVLGMATAIFYAGLISLKQRYLEGHHRIHGPLGSFTELSQYCCVAGPVLAAAALSNFSNWVRTLAGAASVAAGICILLTISRTGVATYAIVMLGVAVTCNTTAITPKKIGALVLVALMTAGITAKSWDSVMERFKDWSLEDEFQGVDETSTYYGRGLYFDLTKLALRDYPFGVGLNNWSYIATRDFYPALGLPNTPYTSTNPSFAGLSSYQVRHTIAPPAHNLALLTLGELGIPGFAVFGILWIRWFQMGGTFLFRRSPDIVSRLGVGILFGLAGVILQSFSEYGFRHTSIFFQTHILLGTLAALYYHRENAPPMPPPGVRPPMDITARPQRSGAQPAEDSSTLAIRLPRIRRL